MIKKLWSNKVFRFACIGVINTLTDVGILNFITIVFGTRVVIANLFSASISICLSYFWNHFFVFRHKDPISWKLFIRFFVITGAGILGIQTLVILGVEHLISIHYIMNLLSIKYNFAKIIRTNVAKLTAVLVSMVWNFFLYTKAVFKTDDEGVVPY